MILQEKWRNSIKAAGGQVHSKITKGICSMSNSFFKIFFLICFVMRNCHFLTNMFITDTNCLVVTGGLNDQNAEIRKAR